MGKLTLAAARKQLKRTYELKDQRVSIRSPGSLGQRVYQLEGGIQLRKEMAYKHARDLVETMVAREVTSLTKIVLRENTWEDSGWSTVYLIGTEVVLIHHSSVDRTALGPFREAELKRQMAVLIRDTKV
jgi:hypothetical protein